MRDVEKLAAIMALSGFALGGSIVPQRPEPKPDPVDVKISKAKARKRKKNKAQRAARRKNR